MARTAIMETLGDRQWVVSWSSINQAKTQFRPNVQKMLSAVVNLKTRDQNAIDVAMQQHYLSDPDYQKD